MQCENSILSFVRILSTPACASLHIHISSIHIYAHVDITFVLFLHPFISSFCPFIVRSYVAAICVYEYTWGERVSERKTKTDRGSSSARAGGKIVGRRAKGKGQQRARERTREIAGDEKWQFFSIKSRAQIARERELTRFRLRRGPANCPSKIINGPARATRRRWIICFGRGATCSFFFIVRLYWMRRERELFFTLDSLNAGPRFLLNSRDLCTESARQSLWLEARVRVHINIVLKVEETSRIWINGHRRVVRWNIIKFWGVGFSFWKS